MKSLIRLLEWESRLVELLLWNFVKVWVDVNTAIVMVFVDQDLGTGVDEKRDAGDPSLEWNKGALFAETHVYVSSYKAALGSKKKKKNKKKKQKQSQTNNNL